MPQSSPGGTSRSVSSTHINLLHFQTDSSYRLGLLHQDKFGLRNEDKILRVRGKSFDEMDVGLSEGKLLSD